MTVGRQILCDPGGNEQNNGLGIWMVQQVWYLLGMGSIQRALGIGLLVSVALQLVVVSNSNIARGKLGSPSS